MTYDSILFILKAGLMTIEVSALAFVAGLFLAAFTAYLSMTKIKVLNLIAWAYIQLMRGTPLLMQMFFIFFSLPLLGIRLSIFTSALVALTTNTGAFMAEIIRASIQSIKKGQWDAAESLGLSRMQIMIKVILPQAIRIAIPPTIGYITALVKNSSVASTIGLVEATRAGRLVVERTGQGLLVFFLVGVLYFIICFPISKLSKSIEKKVY
jgi:polar amino acid transport system permease protein